MPHKGETEAVELYQNERKTLPDFVAKVCIAVRWASSLIDTKSLTAVIQLISMEAQDNITGSFSSNCVLLIPSISS